MSYAPPTITVAATGQAGAALITIAGAGSLVQITRWLDDPAADTIKTSSITLPGPGTHLCGGFADGLWTALVGCFVDHDGNLQSAPSELQKVQTYGAVPRYRIDLRRQDQTGNVDGRTFAFRFRVEAMNPIGLPAEIFLYERQPFQTAGSQVRDVFRAVCKTGDLTEFPAGQPGPDSPLFRLSYIDLIERHADYVEETWEAVLDDVGMLLDSLEIWRRVEVAE